MPVEKFEGSFAREELGVLSLPIKTIELIQEPEVLALWVYLAAKPSTWTINRNDLKKRFDWGVEKERRIVYRLSEYGLLTITKIKEKGKHKGNHYFLHLRPKQSVEMVETVNTKPDTGFPSTAHQALETRALRYNRGDNIENLKHLGALSSQPTKYTEKKKKKFGVEDMLNDNPHNLSQELLEDFKVVKDTKRKAITSTSWIRLNNALTKCGSNGHDVREVFAMMIENGWESINPKWIDDRNKTVSQSNDNPGWMDKMSEGSL